MNPSKILVVDDENYMREIVRRALEDNGFLVEEAADGKAALQMIRRYPYDVIVTDLRMPGSPGERILEEALSIFPEKSGILKCLTKSRVLLTALHVKSSAFCGVNFSPLTSSIKSTL